MDHPGFAIIVSFFGAFFLFGFSLMTMNHVIVGALICYFAALLTIYRCWDDLKLFVYLKGRVSSRTLLVIISLIVIEIATPTCLIITQALKVPEIYFQKFALFWVKTAPETYQLGIAAKLFNEEATSYRVKNLVFNGSQLSWVPRGSYLWRKYAIYPPKLDVIIDDELKANDVRYITRLLPIELEMQIVGGKTMNVVMVGVWNLVLDKININVEPKGYTTYDEPISTQEWEDLLKPKSKIILENLDYQKFTQDSG